MTKSKSNSKPQPKKAAPKQAVNKAVQTTSKKK